MPWLPRGCRRPVRSVRHALDRNIPAILLTGDTSLKESELAGLVKCTMLHKPVDAGRLITLIGKLASKQKALIPR